MTSRPVRDSVLMDYKASFATERGRRVLADILLNAVLLPPPFRPDLPDPAAAEAYKAGLRDGALAIMEKAGIARADLARAAAGLPRHPQPEHPDNPGEAP